MSLNPTFSSDFSAASSAPDAKFSLNINAFNGNTTNFNRCPAPNSKSISVTPVQPTREPTMFTNNTRLRPGMIAPL